MRRVLFVIIQGPDKKVTTRNFHAAHVRIGRAEPADLVIDDPAVSTTHAELAVEGQTVEVRDLGSTNGTKLNGLAVTRAVAKPEDTITIGQHTLKVEVIDDTVHRAPEGAGLEERVAHLEQEFSMLATENRHLREQIKDMQAALAKLLRSEKP